MWPQLRERRILVTGGAGFIGSHLVEELLKRKHEVVVLDNLSTGALTNLPSNHRLTLVQGDIRDSILVDKLVNECDLVFHLAEFIPNTKDFGSGHVVKYSIENPIPDFDVNTRGTLVVLDSARKHGKKFIFTSTAAVYGNTKVPMKETSRLYPLSPYGASKLCSEEFVRLYSRIYGLRASIVRMFNVYGPRQTKYVMCDILLRLQKDPNRLQMLGSGQESRDFIYVKDAVRALFLAAQDEFADGQVYNVGSGKPTQISELVITITELLGVKPQVTFSGSSWSGDIMNLLADIKKISSIGFKPEYSLESGLKELIHWFYHEN